jgi:hypothetical protein
MNRNIPVQVAYDRTNKGVDVREPSTAYFLIDSADRNNYNASTVIGNPTGADATRASADFQITKPGQNLITGFFTRMAMTEIELTWNLFNVTVANNKTNVRLREIATGTITDFPVEIPQGNYTVAEALDALVVAMNATVTGQTFTLVLASTVNFPIGGGRRAIQIGGSTHRFAFTTPRNPPLAPPAPPPTPIPLPASGPYAQCLSQNLGIGTFDFTTTIGTTFYKFAWSATDPNLLATDYIDITCPQLASQQKVKDATTSSFDAIDVVYRWVFANDDANPITFDAYGYPILQGYKTFKSRRLLPFPKQIRWDPLIPVGNLDFQTYTDQETLLTFTSNYERYEFKMLMLLSEV